MNLNKKEEKEMPILGNNSFNKKTVKFSVNSLGKSSGNLLERLKNLSKKDIAFVIAGLGILVMAPIAEFFLSKPQPDNLLAPGFGERKASESGGLNLYDSGVNALSSGSPDGSGEVITPLTARDPSSLIVGAQQTPPPPPPPQTTFRDSMKDVAEKSFSQAVKSSPAPFIPPKMNASLRGFSSFFGGGESSRSSGSLGGGANVLATAKKASTKTEKRSMVGPVAIPGYKGVASNTPNSASKGALEQLRNQAGKAADFFSGDNAIRSLDQAAKESVMADKGEGGGSALFDGAKGDKPSNSSLRGSNSYSPGDPCSGSLENKLNCERAKKAFEYEMWKKYEIPKQIMQAMIDGFLKKGLIDPLSDWMAGTVKELIDPTPPGDPMMCIPPKLDPNHNNMIIPANPSLPASDTSNCIPDFARAYPLFITESKTKDTQSKEPHFEGCCMKMRKSAIPKGSSSPTTPTSVDNSIQANLQNYDQYLIELKKIHDKCLSGEYCQKKDNSNKTYIPNEKFPKNTKQLVDSTAQFGSLIIKDIETRDNAGINELKKSLESSKIGEEDKGKIEKIQKRIDVALSCFKKEQTDQEKVICGKVTQIKEGQAAALENDREKNEKMLSIAKNILDYFTKKFSLCDQYTDRALNFYNNQQEAYFKQKRDILLAQYKNISDKASGNSDPNEDFFSAYLSLEEGDNPLTLLDKYDYGYLFRMAYNPVKSQMRSAPISPHLISVVLSKTTFAQSQGIAQPLTKSAFLQLVNYRGIKLDKFKAESKIEEKTYGLNDGSLLPGQSVRNKFSDAPSIWFINKQKEISESIANNVKFTFPDVYNEVNFNMKIVELNSSSQNEPLDIVAIKKINENIKTDIARLIEVNSAVKDFIGKYLAKPNLYFPLNTPQWIMDLLNGNKDEEACINKPCNNNGNAGPSNSGPTTPNPVCSGPNCPNEHQSGTTNIEKEKKNLEESIGKTLGTMQEEINKSNGEYNRVKELVEACNNNNKKNTKGNYCGKDALKKAEEQLNSMKKLKESIEKEKNEIMKCEKKECLYGISLNVNVEKESFDNAKKSFDTNIDLAEKLANQHNNSPAPNTGTVPCISTIKDMETKISDAEQLLGKWPSCDKCLKYKPISKNNLAKMKGIKKYFDNNKECKKEDIENQDNIFTKNFNSFMLNYSLAKKALLEEKKQFCYNTKSGCATVTSFYVVQRWKVIKQGKYLGFIYSAPTGAEGKVWDIVYDRYNNQLLPTKSILKNGKVIKKGREDVCKEVWDSTWLTIRQYINFSGKSTGIENCNKIWFEPVYEVKYSQSGEVSSGNDVVRIVAKRESGNNTAKSYRGSGQNLFNSEIEVLCSPRNGIWKTDSLSIRIDKPVTYTRSESFSINLGVSGGGLSGGVGYSQSYGVNTSIPYGTWQKISVENLNCGSNMDNISNE